MVETENTVRLGALEVALTRWPDRSRPHGGAQRAHGISISMDGKGRLMDNIMVERLWRTVKYEDIYITGTTKVLKGLLMA